MIFETITRKEPIDKGWSGDRKFRVTTANGQIYLLRVSPMDRFGRCREQFRRMEQMASLSIPMCLPIEFGVCGEGVYTLQSWIEGKDVEEVLPTLPEKRQYAYGLDAGRILQRIHSLPAPADAEPWAARFSRKIDRKLAMYEACELKYEGGRSLPGAYRPKPAPAFRPAPDPTARGLPHREHDAR